MAKTFLNFSYGSNMFTRRLKDRCPSAEAIGTGFLKGHLLTFHKVSIDGSGKCDMESTGNLSDRVYGVIFRINVEEKATLLPKQDDRE